jgi:hypothetical protein
MPTTVNSIDVAKRYFDSVNHTRLEDLAAVFAEDALLTFPGVKPIRGRKAIRDFYAGILSFYPRRFDGVTRWFVSDCGDVAAEIHFEGRTLSNREVIFDAVDVFTIKNGLIQDLHIHFDNNTVARMVGEVPREYLP